MSGRKHHYLPRFLQRAFAFQQKGDEFYVYAHHRAHGAYAVNVMRLGQELDFYGGPQDTALDDAITGGEGQLAISVHRLISGEEVSQSDIAKLISALSIRTKAMRKALTNLLPSILDAGRSRILNAKRIRKQFREEMLDPKKQRALVEEQIRKRPGLSREQRAKMLALMLPRWKSFVVEREDEFAREFRGLALVLFDKLLSEAAALADRAYLEAMSRDPGMPERAARLEEEIHFDVWETGESEFFVLGDCGPVALFTDGAPRLALGAFDGNTKMDFVFLPVSPNKCVVGRRNMSDDHGQSTVNLNQISAALSHEFVISHLKESEALVELRGIIGSLTPIETEEMIFRVINDDD